MSEPGNRPYWQFLGRPRYWVVWLFYWLGRLIVFLPLDAQLWLGRQLGRVAFRFMDKERDVARRNYEICFPEKTGEERESLVREVFASLGMSFVEMGFGWWASERRLRQVMEISGLEHLFAAAERGRGVLLQTGHFTTMEFAAMLIGLVGPPAQGFYRPNRKNPLADEIVARGRLRFSKGMIPKDDVRRLAKVLKEGYVVWYTSDQRVRHGKREHRMPFFGVPARCNIGTPVIARMTKAPVVPFFPRRMRRDGRTVYRIEVLPELQNFPTDDPLADTQRINELLEAYIRKAPEQYLWTVARFKKRDHLPNLYEGILSDDGDHYIGGKKR